MIRSETFILLTFILFISLLNPTESTNESLNETNELAQLAKLNKSKTTDDSLKTQINQSVKPKQKTMTINSDLTVTNSITTDSLTCKSANITGQLDLQNKLTANLIQSDSINTKVIFVEQIQSPTGTLTINGNLIINNDITTETINMKGTSFILDGVTQWALVHHDDFETEKSLDGWSDKRTSRCREGGNTFLGGHCNFSFNEVSKVFKNLPGHSKIRVNAAYHMLDSWDGEMAYMKVDDVIVWTKRGIFDEKNGINICGGDHNDPAFNIAVEANLPHNASEVKISFGSSLDEDPCNESFGVDDVMIYIR